MYGPEMATEYNVKLARLAFDVKELLEKLGAAAPAGRPEAQPAPSKPPIYLAQCCSEQHEAREALATELRLGGYPVVPDRPLPTEEAAYIDEVRRLLEPSALSIHLVGSGCGLIPDGSGEKSVVVLQNELAAERSRTASLRRVIWLPRGTESVRPAHQAFIDKLHNDPDTQLGADLITADFESLKGAVHAALKRREGPSTAKRRWDAPFQAPGWSI